MTSSKRRNTWPGSNPVEIGTDGVDGVVDIPGTKLNVGTDGEVGVKLPGGLTVEGDGDVRIGGINLTGD